MRKIGGIIYYTMGDIAAICNRKLQSVTNWDKYSDELEARGDKRLIPKALRLNNQRLYTQEQKDQILKFSQKIKRGQLAEWSRRHNGVRGQEIQARLDKAKEEAEKKARNMLEGLENVSRGKRITPFSILKSLT